MTWLIFWIILPIQWFICFTDCFLKLLLSKNLITVIDVVGGNKIQAKLLDL